MVQIQIRRWYQMSLLLFILCVVSARAQNYSNPISDFADPFITYDNGNYYLTGTTGNGVVLRRSPTLDGLKRAATTVIFTNQVPGAPCCNYWAPEIHRINGRWYAYFTAGSSPDLATERTYVLEGGTGDPFSSGWTFRGQIADVDNIWAIDGTVLQLNGAYYFLWSSGDYGQSIAIAQMTSPWSLSGRRTIISRPQFPYESDRPLNEGPAVLQHNGRTFVTFSASGCETPNYNLGMLTLTNPSAPLDPSSWSKSTSSVFSRNDATATYGPGHNGFFTSPDGTESWLVYHATALNNGQACDATRNTRAQKIYWNGDDSPTFAVPVKPGKILPAPSGEVPLASSVPLANGLYRFTPFTSQNSAMDLANCSNSLGAAVAQYQWADNDCQKWNLQATGDGYYTITSYASGLALEVAGSSTADGIQLSQWAPNGAWTQQWRIEDVGGGLLRVVNRNSGKVLDVQNGAPDNGTIVQQYAWLNGNNQKWRLNQVGQPRVDNGVYGIFSEVGGMALDVAGCATAPMASLDQWTWLNNDCQRWSVEDVGGNSYRLVAQNSGLVLERPSCTTTAGDLLQLYSWLNNDCQRWFITPAGNGYYNITSSSGLAVDVQNNSPLNGARVDQWNLWNGPCQRWRFERVTATAAGNRSLAALAAQPAAGLASEARLTVYPNPAVDYLRLRYTFAKAGPAKIDLLDVVGKTVVSRTEKTGAGDQELQVNTNPLVPGIYILRLSTGGQVLTCPVAITK